MTLPSESDVSVNDAAHGGSGRAGAAITTLALECIDGPDGCAGPVALRWPGYGDRSWPRCRLHGEQRLKREEAARVRYPTLRPVDFDELDAGER